MEDRNRTLRLGAGMSVEIEWEPDQDGDTSMLGKFINGNRRSKEGLIVRTAGVLLGESFSGEGYFEREESADALFYKLDDCVDNEEVYTDDNGKKWFVTSVDVVEECDDDTGCIVGWTVMWDGYAVLAQSDYRANVDKNRRFEYAEPSSRNFPHDPESWTNVDPDTLARVVAEHGSIEAADYACTMLDWVKLEKYGDEWGFWCLQVTLHVGDGQFTESLCGIDSDNDDEALQRYENELTDALLSHEITKTGVMEYLALVIKGAVEDGEYDPEPDYDDGYGDGRIADDDDAQYFNLWDNPEF